jgi:hypothetical protein
MEPEKIAAMIQQEGITTQITCSQAWSIAEKLGISKQEIGAYCEANKIKIRECQLGCF